MTIRLIALAVIFGWIGFALTAVHQAREPFEYGQVYGWTVPLSVAVMVLSTAVTAFFAGVEYRDDELK